jgi:hypothetical protein
MLDVVTKPLQGVRKMCEGCCEKLGKIIKSDSCWSICDRAQEALEAADKFRKENMPTSLTSAMPTADGCVKFMKSPWTSWKNLPSDRKKKICMTLGLVLLLLIVLRVLRSDDDPYVPDASALGHPGHAPCTWHWWWPFSWWCPHAVSYSAGILWACPQGSEPCGSGCIRDVEPKACPEEFHQLQELPGCSQMVSQGFCEGDTSFCGAGRGIACCGSVRTPPARAAVAAAVESCSSPTRPIALEVQQRFPPVPCIRLPPAPLRCRPAKAAPCCCF